MEIKETKKLKKNLPRFFCEPCDFKCYMKCDWDRHILRPKHLKYENGNNLEINLDEKTYQCCCGKKYSSKSGLWKHNKVCNVTNNDDINEPKDINEQNDVNENIINTNKMFELTQETIINILKQNSEFQQMLLEQNKTIIELSKNNSITNNTTNNNNSHNKTFNLNMFLNETCKNAMNITDFVDSLQLQMSDLENVGEVGYIEGISSIIINKLNTLDVTERPIHCTDKKRETMYVKDEDKWEKEDEKKTKMHKMVTRVANKNINMISEFQKLHPEWKKCSSKYADQHNKIVIESMGGKGDNEYEKQEKIIKKIAKEVFVEKCL
jgi:Txe/YoeB family toxin of Txe-Axe toxin-antitoxin module